MRYSGTSQRWAILWNFALPRVKSIGLTGAREWWRQRVTAGPGNMNQTFGCHGSFTLKHVAPCIRRPRLFRTSSATMVARGKTSRATARIFLGRSRRRATASSNRCRNAGDGSSRRGRLVGRTCVASDVTLSMLIRAAGASEFPATALQERTTIGVGRHGVLCVAEQLIDAMKAGWIRHFS